MKYILFILLFSANVFATDAMKCFDSTPEIMGDIDPLYEKIFETASPFGYWKSKKDQDFVAHFFLNWKADTLGLTLSNRSMVGQSTHSQDISLCIKGERTFLKTKDGYMEYYLKGEKTMMIANDEFDVDEGAGEATEDEPRSDFDWTELTKAKVIID